ncbi:hypothetical protein C8F01DRAFT_1259593 [Mycena amicta]|nr:hypothetical protein C8F01DRAFT_1259593 [Mycena amicta]
MDELSIRKLVHDCVPCFVVGVVPSDQVASLNIAEDPSSFLEGTQTLHALQEGNPYALVPRWDVSNPRSEESSSAMPKCFGSAAKRSLSVLSRLDRDASRLERRALSCPAATAPEANAKYAGSIPRIKNRPAPVRAPTPPQFRREEAMAPAAAGLGFSDEDDEDEGSIEDDDSRPPAVVPSTPLHQPPVHRVRMIDPDRVGWYVPPPIAAATVASRSQPIRRYIAGFVGNRQPAMFMANKRQGRGTGIQRFWDRENSRILEFRGLRLPPGVLGVARYGAPVPPAFFFAWDQHGRWKPVKPSMWMYLDERPSNRRDVGESAPVPTPEQLPQVEDREVVPPHERPFTTLSPPRPSLPNRPGAGESTPVPMPEQLSQTEGHKVVPPHERPPAVTSSPRQSLPPLTNKDSTKRTTQSEKSRAPTRRESPTSDGEDKGRLASQSYKGKGKTLPEDVLMDVDSVPSATPFLEIISLESPHHSCRTTWNSPAFMSARREGVLLEEIVRVEDRLFVRARDATQGQRLRQHLERQWASSEFEYCDEATFREAVWISREAWDQAKENEAVVRDARMAREPQPTGRRMLGESSRRVDPPTRTSAPPPATPSAARDHFTPSDRPLPTTAPQRTVLPQQLPERQLPNRSLTTLVLENGWPTRELIREDQPATSPSATLRQRVSSVAWDQEPELLRRMAEGREYQEPALLGRMRWGPPLCERVHIPLQDRMGEKGRVWSREDKDVQKKKSKKKTAKKIERDRQRKLAKDVVMEARREREREDDESMEFTNTSSSTAYSSATLVTPRPLNTPPSLPITTAFFNTPVFPTSSASSARTSLPTPFLFLQGSTVPANARRDDDDEIVSLGSASTDSDCDMDFADN